MTTTYATTTEIKTFLQISSSSKDTLIGVLNQAATEIINGALGVKTLAAQTITKELQRMFYNDRTGNYEVYLNHSPLISVDNVYDVDDVEITDFVVSQPDVANTRRIIFDKDNMNWRDNILVTYQAGYVTQAQSDELGGVYENDDVTMPEDIKLAVAYIVGGMISEPSRRGGVSSYSLGSKTVSFRSQSEYSIVSGIINAYLSRFKAPQILA